MISRSSVRQQIMKPDRKKKKVKKVMGEFKRKKLKSSSGKKVTNRKQAIAIALNSKLKKRRS
jgi:thymidylate synthase